MSTGDTPLIDEQIRQTYLAEMSESLSGQRTLYNQYIAADSYFGSLSSTLRATVKDLFPRAAAAYSLENIANPSETLNFRDYLHQQGYKWMSESLYARLQYLARRGILPAKGESLAEYQQNRTDDPWRHVRTTLFADEEQMHNLIQQAALQRVSGMLRGYAEDVLERRIAAFRDTNLTKPLFSEFIDRDMSW